MKIVANIPLHYGREYLGESISAIEPFVDEVIVLYTPEPSYGQHSAIKCPEPEDELHEIAKGAAGDKLRWVRQTWRNEGEHRNFGYAVSANADLILQIDADEVWDRESLERCIQLAQSGTQRNFGIRGFVHFWRSFGWCCRDVWTPVRIIKPSGSGDTTLEGTIYHFGYAQSERIVGYKMSVHGHKAELRPDWFQKRFLANERRDIHPVVIDWWNAELFDRRSLPHSLRIHPNFAKEVIQ